MTALVDFEPSAKRLRVEISAQTSPSSSLRGDLFVMHRTYYIKYKYVKFAAVFVKRYCCILQGRPRVFGARMMTH